MSVLTILVVSSERVAARQLGEHLARTGFDVDVASSCWTARTMAGIRTYRSLVCFVDLSLAGDRECLTALREQSPRAWIIAIIAATSTDMQPLVTRLGADALLSQPFSKGDLTTRLAAFSLRARPHD